MGRFSLKNSKNGCTSTELPEPVCATLRRFNYALTTKYRGWVAPGPNPTSAKLPASIVIIFPFDRWTIKHFVRLIRLPRLPTWQCVIASARKRACYSHMRLLQYGYVALCLGSRSRVLAGLPASLFFKRTRGPGHMAQSSSSQRWTWIRAFNYVNYSCVCSGCFVQLDRAIDRSKIGDGRKYMHSSRSLFVASLRANTVAMSI